MDCHRTSFVRLVEWEIRCSCRNVKITMGIFWRLRSTVREGDVAMYSYQKDEIVVDGGAAFHS